MKNMSDGNVKIWTAAAVASAVLGVLGLFLHSGLAIPGLILGAMALGAVSSGRAGAGNNKTVKAVRLTAAIGLCLSLIVVLAMIMKMTSR